MRTGDTLPSVPSRLVAATAAVTMVLLSGCATDGAGTAEATPWSTREQSVLGRAPDEPGLAVRSPSSSGAAGRTDGAAVRGTAVDLLMEATRASDPLLRANALEGLQSAPSYLGPAVQAALADPNRGVRFVAAMSVGRSRLDDLTLLVEPLLSDPSESVRAAAIYALRRNGVEVDPTPLASMLRSGDPEVKGNAALVVGELGEPSALPMLRDARGAPLPRASVVRARLVDLQIAEAMVKLGDLDQLEGIRAALFAPHEQGEVTALACLICGRTGDAAAANNMLDLAMRTDQWQQSPEVRMAATHGLALLDPARAPLQVPGEYLDADRAELRAQAALTLGATGSRRALPEVSARLADPDPMVQVSAAAAILRIVPE